MLGLVLVMTLAQCSKDTDCKGERVCNAGQCIEPIGSAPPAYAPVREAPSNPFHVHRWVAMSLGLGLYVATIVGAGVLSNWAFDGYSAVNFVPVLGPLINFLAVQLNPDLHWIGATGPVLLWVSTILQVGALTYLLVMIVKETSWEPPVVIGPGPGLGVSIALRL